MSVGQLKILQEVIALSVFVPFSYLYLKEKLTLDYLWAGLCILGAAFFIFRRHWSCLAAWHDDAHTATAKTENRVRASASANRTKHLLFVLLFLAIPLFAGLFLLQQNIPFPKLDARIGQLDDGTHCVYWTDYQSGSTYHSGNPFSGKGSKSKLLDLQTGQVRSIDSYLMIDKRSVNTRGEVVAVGSKYSLSEMGSKQSWSASACERSSIHLLQKQVDG